MANMPGYMSGLRSKAAASKASGESLGGFDGAAPSPVLEKSRSKVAGEKVAPELKTDDREARMYRFAVANGYNPASVRGSIESQLQNTINRMSEAERHPSFTSDRMKELYNTFAKQAMEFNEIVGEGSTDAIQIPGMPEVIEGGKGWESRGAGYIKKK